MVDDDEDVLVFAAEALNSFAPGFDVATGRDLEAALLWLDVFPPDIVLFDQNLCGKEIDSVLAGIRSNRQTRHCKFVAFSDAPRATGVDAVLTKPLHLQALLTTVRSVLERSSSL